MRLFLTSFLLACKHSGKRLLCLLCILAACFLLGRTVLAASSSEPPQPVRIAVVNEDQNPLSRMAVQMLIGQKQLSSLFEVCPVTLEQSKAGEYAAVLTVPDGFLDSVFNGSNLSPTLEVQLTTPLEAMLVRQLAQAGADYLTLAQLCIYTVQEGVEYGRGMPEEQYALMLADVNLSVMRSILSRSELIEESPLSASGGLSLPGYYLSALLPLLTLCYAFLYQPVTESMRRLAQLCGGKIPLFCAVWLHLLVLAMVPTALLFWHSDHSVGAAALWLLLSAQLAAAQLLMLLLLRETAASAAGCLLLSVSMGACSGCFLPLALMPPVFSKIAPFTATGQARAVAAALLGEPVFPAQIFFISLSVLFLLLFSGILWSRGVRR